MGNHTDDCDYCGQDLRGLMGGHAADCQVYGRARDTASKFYWDPVNRLYKAVGAQPAEEVSSLATLAEETCR